jgi:hypothetical protein
MRCGWWWCLLTLSEKFPKSNDNIIERDKIYISNIKIHYSSILWLRHVYVINAIYHQITKGKDEHSVKYHAFPTVRTISYYSKVYWYIWVNVSCIMHELWPSDDQK